MALTECTKCGAQISSNAARCPKCKTENMASKSGEWMLPCRTCGEMLLEKKHRFKSYISSDRISSVDPRTGTVNYGDGFSYLDSRPCPKCGEKQPIVLPSDIGKPRRVLGFWVMTTLLCIWIGNVFYHTTSHVYWNMSGSHYTAPWGYIVIPFVLFVMMNVLYFKHMKRKDNQYRQAAGRKLTAGNGNQ